MSLPASPDIPSRMWYEPPDEDDPDAPTPEELAERRADEEYERRVDMMHERRYERLKGGRG